jgi:hypothetical protein
MNGHGKVKVMDNASSNTFYEEISELCRGLNGIAKIAIAQLKPEVDTVIRSGCKDDATIQRLLDRLLDYAPYEGGLPLYKRLLRYYYPINATSTANYIRYYKEMYEDEDENSEQNVFQPNR